MSAPPSKPSQPSATTFNERLNEQLVNCLNVQTNVIQNLAQYSQHISLQLIEIKSIVEILSNRVLALQQQQQQQSHFPPSHYAASYYPNYMSPHPSQIPVSHPLSSSHPQSIPPSVQQPSLHMRVPNTSAMPTNPNFPFFSPNVTNPPPPTAPQQQHHQPPPAPQQHHQPPPPSTTTNPQPFQFSTSTAGPPPSSSLSQTTVSNTLPTTPSKSIFSNIPKFGVADTTTKTQPQQPSSSISSFFQTNTTNEKPSTNSIFSFGTNNTSSSFGVGSLVSGMPTFSTTKQETNADDNGEDDGEDDGEEDTDYANDQYKLVNLSAVEVKTGEEDENVLFCERGKLYRFDSATNQMKERGIGEMKILQHKTTKICRVLMRREQVLKICANHQINSQMELKPHQGSANAYLWSAMDFADGEAKHETLCVRFKTEEQAKNFAKIFNEAKEINSKKSGDLPSIGKISLNDETKTKSTTNDDDIVTINEVKPSQEQIDRAKELQLPSTFYLYENKEPCKGCPGCEEDTPPLVPNENKTTTTTKKSTDIPKTDVKPSTPQTPSTTSGPKTPLSSSENIKFSFTNNNNNTDKPQLQKQTSSTTKDEKPAVESPSPAPNATSQYDNKPSIFGNFNATSNQSIFGGTTPLGNSNGSIFGGGASLKSTNNGFSFPGFGGAPTTPSTGFQFSTPTGPSTTAPTNNTSSTFSFGTSETSSTNQPLFGNAPKFSFADLAKQTPSSDKPTSNGTEQRVFAGQGSLIFGTSSANTTLTTTTTTNDDDEGEGGGEDDSYEPNVSFKPIVQLSAVEVKTGEEDENVLFCERGKLYRFDSATNQMKERGIGEMKILQHKTTKICRILMRREQVLKICANHQISSQMELKPHQGSENAYVWSAMDFADGEAKHETLCIRFKSSDLANKFVKQFNEAKQANANGQQ